MRFRLDGGEWLAERLVGQWEFLGTDRHTGVCNVRCQLALKGDTAYVYHPEGKKASVEVGTCDITPAHDHSTCQVGSQTPFPQGRETHWRLCYARELAETVQPCWRVRDERTGELWFANDYRGVVNINYFDKGSHVFVDGKAYVDEQGVARFG